MSRKSSSASEDAELPKSTEAVLPPYEETKSAVLDDKPEDVEKQITEEKIPYPKSVFFIIINEFCERFNYYGMRTVLTLYMRNILGFDEGLATVLYHTFIMLCYFSPVIGAIIADNYLGKFKTILSLSIFYAFGSIILSIAAIPNFLPQTAFSMLGLLIIAFGTGGIKPCVSAFGGDQFVRPQQDRQLEAFFSVFYFSINAGSLISTFLTPILREDVHCFGEKSCYSLAFGVPAVLMLIAVVIFAFGKPLYKIKKPEGNILGDFARCIGRGIKRRFSVKGEKHEHWLDYAADKYSKQLIEDTKRVLAVGLIFLPLPVFWTLYDQQGSRWTFQATRMNGDLGGFVLKPDQMQIVNPLLILLLVPLFESFIYPLFKRCGLLTPLQRIGCGLVLCGLSFVVSAFVEIALEPTYAKFPNAGQMRLNFISTIPCNVSVNYQIGEELYNANVNQTLFVERLPAGQNIFIHKAFTLTETCAGEHLILEQENVTLGVAEEMKGYSVYITSNNNQDALNIFRTVTEEQIEKSISGDPYIAFLHLGDVERNFTIKNSKTGLTYLFSYNTSDTLPVSYDGTVLETAYDEVDIGIYDIYNGVITDEENKIGSTTKLIQGGVYRILLSQNNASSLYNVTQVEITSPNTVSILWLLPQYFVVTVGEVLFSVTGLSFSFTQAPVSMKSVMQAMWNMVVAFGNLIVIIIEGANTGLSQRDEFFLFAGIMAVAAVIFTFLAIRYEYVEDDVEEKKSEKDLEPHKGEDDSASSDSSSSSDDENKEKSEDH